MFIYGNIEGGFQLYADSYPDYDRNWIVAELVNPASAVGTRYIFNSTLSAYAADGTLLATVEHIRPGEHFLGIVSDTPIARVTIDQGFYSAWSDAFIFADFPEPSTGILLLMSGAAVLARPRLRRVLAR